MDPDASSGRVSAAALERLATGGYASTTLDDVAGAAGVPVGELRARFGDLDGLLSHLVCPLSVGLRELAGPAGGAGLAPASAVRAVLGRYYDLLVAHRRLVRVVLHDPAAAASQPGRQLRATMASFETELAGGAGAGLDRTIRAASAMGALHDAALGGGDADPMTMRRVVIDAAVAILCSGPGTDAGG